MRLSDYTALLRLAFHRQAVAEGVQATPFPHPQAVR